MASITSVGNLFRASEEVYQMLFIV